MISSASNKKISIHITTYKPDVWQENLEMDEKNTKKVCKSRKVVCSLCLNSKLEERNIELNKKATKSCPICQKNCGYCQVTTKRDTEVMNSAPEEEANVKNVQTSDTNVAEGLNLLNEVLTVFQNKKGDITKVKSGFMKDVAVSTDDNRKYQSKLTVSTFHYSIDEMKRPENGQFTIVNSCQPDYIRKSQYSIDLIKHKSSSIPQMKLEELKYSLKAKSKSKDAIEEVNRMFATVRKAEQSLENCNRPMLRSGPRVLPVVKNLVRQDTISVNVDSVEKVHCRCCQTCMSSGDSFMMPEYCREIENDKRDKCVYMLCCHYQSKHKMQPDKLMCEHCKSLKQEHLCEHEYFDGSC